MKSYSTPRHVVSTVIYSVVLIFILYLNNLGVSWLIRTAFAPMLNWFYGISLFLKLLFLFAGLTIIFSLTASIYKMIASAISVIMSRLFLQNWATWIISIILCLTNIVFITIDFIPYWQWDFWLIVFWFTLWWFAVQTNVIFIYRGKENSDHEISEPKEFGIRKVINEGFIPITEISDKDYNTFKIIHGEHLTKEEAIEKYNELMRYKIVTD